jgi:hypothetical protein
MQIVKSSNNREFKTSISHQCNLPFYNKGQSMLKSNIKMLLKKLNAKRQRQTTFQSLWKRWTHSLMKRSISHLHVACTFMAIGIKWCPSWSPLYLRILAMVLSFTTTHVGWLMTFVAFIFHVQSIATTLATKTLSHESWVHNKTLDVRVYHCSFRNNTYSFPILSSEGIHDVSNGVMCGYLLTFERTTC